MIDDVELDNERHRREEQERRAKRQKNRETKSKSGHQSEKERKRREHVQRILGAQKKKPSPQPLSSAPPQPVSISRGGASIFQSLFHERAEGFFIDLRFRNAPPRPPVGPTFVGLGLGGELTNKWAKYKARNAVENQYTWKLHPERDLGVPLAVSAIDYEGCYTDRGNKDYVKGEEDTGGGFTKNSKSPHHFIPALLPDDEALINWKGSSGDTATEQLQQKQDMVRAAARLAIAQGYGAMPIKRPTNTPSSLLTGGGNNNGSVFRLKKHHLQSRILDEKTPNFMKKTTYLTNDATSVHRFTSLAHTQVQRAKDVDQALAETKTKYSEMDMIERGFRKANFWKIIRVGSKGASCENMRGHPSQKDVHPMWDLPLLPDVPTWGHTHTHVVLDNPPKNISSNIMTPTKKTVKDTKPAGWNLFTAKQLHKAVVADVTKQTQNARMACTLWVPESCESNKVLPESEFTEPATKKSKKGQVYLALQQYDLDVVPLRDPSVPPVHYVWTVDSSKTYVGYHCVGSRVQLSTGRPFVVSGTPYGANTAEIATNKSYILHKPMEVVEKKNFEIRMAEVDVDLAEKYGLVDVNGLETVVSNDVVWGHSKPIPDSDSDGIEADAF